MMDQQTHQWQEVVAAAKSASLATISSNSRIVSFPFLSVVPVAFDEGSLPFICISNLAEHTKNLSANAQASMMFADIESQQSPQKSWRYTLTGILEKKIEKQKVLRDLYAQQVPDASQFLSLPGFDFWSFKELNSVRFIQGFGQIKWIDLRNFDF